MFENQSHPLMLLTTIWLALVVSTLATSTDSTANADSSLIRHPVSIVEADIYVNRTKTTMRLKCFAEDLELLQGVEALEDGLYDSDELLDATQDHAKYLAERVQLIDAEGNQLEPKIVEIIDIEIPEEGIRAGTLMNYPMGFTLEFKHSKPPEFLTVNQKMIADGALLPSELKILMKQAGSDTPYTHMMKPDKPETFRFDWDRPVLSSEASEKEWEDWFEEQREKTLGITSYSSVYSFIYITRYEVRHEVLIPLASLTTFIELDGIEDNFLDIEEQDAAKKKIEALFSIGNEVEIDSVVVKPVFDRIDFYGLDLRDFAMQAERRKISLANGRVGIIMSYSTKGTPRDVKVTWDKFNTAVKTVDGVVIAFDKVEKTEFTKFLEDNTYEWTQPDLPPLPAITGVSAKINPEEFEQPKLKFSIVSVALIGLGILLFVGRLISGGKMATALLMLAGCIVAGFLTSSLAMQEINHPFKEKKPFKLANQDAELIFEQLHKNLFRAFDYHQETDVYDALANSVDGELLRKLYLEINSSLRVKEQGGAVSRIDEVKIVDGKQVDEASTSPSNDEGPAFDYQAKWELVGTIEHWGHIHERTNQYDAKFTVGLRDDAWKITEMQVEDITQGTVKNTPRKF